jgi:hypothetical protein
VIRLCARIPSVVKVMWPSRSVRNTATPWPARRARTSGAGWPYELRRPTLITASDGASSESQASDVAVRDPW